MKESGENMGIYYYTPGVGKAFPTKSQIPVSIKGTHRNDYTEVKSLYSTPLLLPSTDPPQWEIPTHKKQMR